jgi:Leucine-rich repeat (LRR) protein
LSGNRLTAVPDWLGNLTALKRLDLSGNRLTALPKSLGNLAALELLDLSGNRLTALPKSLGNLAALEDLRLGTGPGPPAVVEPRWLDISGRMMPLITEPVEGKGSSDQRGNRLTSVPESLGNLTALKFLDLSGNRLTSVPESLGNLTALRRLDLRDNQLTVLPQRLADLRTDGMQLALEGNQQDLTFAASPYAWRGALLDRAWMRLRLLFAPSVSLDAVLAAADMNDSGAAVLQLYTWERDRLLTLAKGAAGAAITVLTGLIAAAIEGKVVTNKTVLFLAAALVAGLLLWGGFLLTELRRLAEEYATALTFRK